VSKPIGVAQQTSTDDILPQPVNPNHVRIPTEIDVSPHQGKDFKQLVRTVAGGRKKNSL